MHGPLAINGNVSTKEANRLIDDAIERHYASIFYLKSQESCLASLELHQASILALKSQRNSFASISRIPPEVLGKVFEFTKAAIEPPLFPLYKLKGTPRWLKMTHVSRHWRDLAINLLASLWVNLRLDNLPFLEKMLSRSKGAGLVIQASFSSPSGVAHYSPNALDLALNDSSRIKVLSLKDVRWDTWKYLKGLLPKSAPQLEYLCLTGSSIDLIIPEEILCKTPKLRRLELTRFGVDWISHSHLLRSLTHLKLHSIIRNSPPTWKQFVNVLKRMPHLEVLDLNVSLSNQAFEKMSLAPPVFGSIHLASLRALSINCNKEEMDTFLTCVTFPPSAKVVIECHEFFNGRPDFHGVLLRLAQLYSNTLFDTHLQTLILYQPPQSPGVRLKLFTDALADWQMIDHKNMVAQFVLSFCWSPNFSTRANFTHVMNDIFSVGIPVQNVRRVYLGEKIVEFDSETLANTIGTLGQVHSVMAARNTGRILVNALQLRLHVEQAGRSYIEHTVSPAETIYFPSLSSIYFYRSRFKESDQYKRLQDDPRALPIRLLYDCVVQRHKSGAPEMEKLSFKFCRKLFKDDIAFLKKMGFVHNIDWDNEEIDAHTDYY